MRSQSVAAFGVCVAVLAVSAMAVPAVADVEIMPTGGRNVYRLAVAKTAGGPSDYRIIGSTYDNRVCEFDAGGKHLWDAPVGGFVFGLACGDLDGDGTDEVAAAAADGQVYVFDADGKLLWQSGPAFQEAPVWQVCVARLDGKTPTVVAGGISREVISFSARGQRLATAKTNGAVRIMLAADFDGDGADEVAVLPVRGQAKDLVFYEGPKLTLSKQRIPTEMKPWNSDSKEAKAWGERFRKGKRIWTGASLKSANGAVGDLDGDGAAELIYNPGAFSLRGGVRQLVELPETFKVPSYDRHYNMRLLAAGDLTDAPGAEIVVLEGAEIRLFDSKGESLGTAVAPLGFTDVVYAPGSPHGSVLLGSSPNGDDNIYRVRFQPGWEKALEGLQQRGAMARIGENLRHVADAAASWRGRPLAGQPGPYDVVVSHHMWSGSKSDPTDGWIAEVRQYERKFPYPNLRFSTCFWPGEDAPLVRPDGKPWGRDNRLAHDLSRAQIVAGARHFEDVRCPFWVQVGHGCCPHLEVATVAEMLKAAPTTCLGFISAEDEQIDEVPYYFEHHIKPILDLCLAHKKHFIPRNKDVWWAHWPADPRMRGIIFNGRYRSVLLPSVEDSNSRVADVNLAARVGLWLDGQVDGWASRCSADWFCASRAWEWEYVLTGHPQLRYYVSQAMLGARVFMMLNGERERRTGNWTRVGSEGTATFLHLLGKGVIAPPEREQLSAVSPVALVMRDPSERFKEHGANGHHEENWGSDGSDSKAWAFDRLDAYWAMAPLPATDVSTYLWGRTRRDASHVPVTAPQGFVALVPGGEPQSSDRWTSLWTTDGDRLGEDGRWVALGAARDKILAELAEGAPKFPFRIQGRVFQQVVRQLPDHYVIVLVDPGWLDPADRQVTLAAQLPGRWQVADRLSGQGLGSLDDPLDVTVPAGTLRLLDVWQPGRQ